MSQTRMTKQRTVILDALRGVTSHPTADEIYGMVRKTLPRISLGTVYRNLELLTNSGEIMRLDRAGSQKRFDGNSAPHQHIRCQVCGKIGDIPLSMPMPSTAAIAAPGFDVHHVEIEFVGTCHACKHLQPAALAAKIAASA